MEKLKDFYFKNKRKIVIYSCIFSILLIASIIFIGINNKYDSNNDYSVIASVEEKELKNESVDTKIQKEVIKVDVKGYIENPGVYELLVGARVIDAIKAAGGLTEESYTRYLNLSKKLEDENVIIVNSKDEIEIIKKGENKEIYCEETNKACLETKDIITNDLKSDNKNTNKQDITSKNNDNVNTLVNINTASKEELIKLSGIGESIALRIIEYREENGNFNSIEDIMNVKGIGESIYAKIKKNITV